MKCKSFLVFNTLLLAMLWLSSCSSNKFDVDISGEEVSVEWLRLDHDFTGLATKPDFQKYNDSLLAVYGDFYMLYASRVMRFGDVHSPSFEPQVMRFLMHKDIHQLHRKVDSTFSDISNLHSEISLAFSYYHHYFPERKIPVVASMVTGLSNNIVVTDSILGVGLDLYLGDSSEVYQLAAIPEYIRKKSDKKYMVCDMMRGWVLSEFEPQFKKDDLLSQMINFGKGMYVMDAMFPNQEDYLKIGFTSEEINWCMAHEADVWARFIEEGQLYSTDMNVVRAFTGPGPFTPGFPKESPAQLGYWVGWQIVRNYMESNPELTIENLLQIEDAQAILRDSKYKPR